MNPRSEPLLWLQLLGLAAIPAELLGLLLILAGADPGRLPGLERVLCWGLGSLLPALALWKRPADVWSLLLVRTPSRGRRDLQRRLSGLQSPLVVKLGGAFGAMLLLPLLWRLDGMAAQAAGLTPLVDGSRLLTLLLAVPLQALILWQWQQALQAAWLLTRPEAELQAAAALSGERLESERLVLGLPLLLPDPLALAAMAASAAAAPAAVEPEQPPEQAESPDLDQQVG